MPSSPVASSVPSSPGSANCPARAGAFRSWPASTFIYGIIPTLLGTGGGTGHLLRDKWYAHGGGGSGGAAPGVRDRLVAGDAPVPAQAGRHDHDLVRLGLRLHLQQALGHRLG